MAGSNSVFQQFCESTSLHGYSYLFNTKSVCVRIAWILVIVTMTSLGLGFLVINTNKYLESRLVTTVESSTAPLEEAVMPSLTVCNFNQLEASFMRKIGIHGKADLTELVLNEYMIGRKENLTQDEEETLKSIIDGTYPYYSGNESDVGPYYYGTDYGACCFLTPHLDLGNRPANISTAEMYHNLDASAKQGIEEGLNVLFDVEQFNYGYTKGDGAGLIISLSDHRNKPMMQFSSQYLQSGTETQIVINPVIIYTTEQAINTFEPEERNCYDTNEKTLQYLPWDHGFRYEMSNCLIDQGLHSVFWNCRCYPVYSVNDDLSTLLEPCTGQKLRCANQVLKLIGSQSYMKEQVEQVPEAIESPDVIGNFTRKEHIRCKPACKIQENGVVMSSARFPPDANFFQHRSFCDVASHILQASCSDEHREYFLTDKHPKLCEVLQDHEKYFGNTSTCKQWPGNYYIDHEFDNKTLAREIQQYAKHNLALAKVYFQSPYLTKIKRDVEITFTDFIANTGGLLGLYLGFSIISIFEVFYWFVTWLGTCFKKFKRIDTLQTM